MSRDYNLKAYKGCYESKTFYFMFACMSKADVGEMAVKVKPVSTVMFCCCGIDGSRGAVC